MGEPAFCPARAANLVLTRNSAFKAPKAEVFTDVHAMIGRGFEIAGETGADEIMLIGGAKLYASLMRYCSRMYITEVDAMIEGDAHFPVLRADQWQLTSEASYAQGPKDDYPFSVKIYDRK